MQVISSGEGSVVLVELRLLEQRHQAVLEVFSGVSVTQVALRYGVTRRTVHRWLRRYGSLGLAGLADTTSRPASCPHQMPPEIEARIITLRAEHPELSPPDDRRSHPYGGEWRACRFHHEVVGRVGRCTTEVEYRVNV